MKKRTLPNSFLKDIKPYILKNVNKILVLSDIHIPYNNQKAIQIAINKGKQEKIDTVILLGDLIDLNGISRFLKNPKNPDINYEIEKTIEFLKFLRLQFPKKRIIYVEGNHEERLQKYIFSHPELINLECLKLEEILGLKKLNIEFIKDKQMIKCGKLWICHGHEFPVGGLQPCKRAIDKYHTSVIFGHLHKSNEYFSPTLDGEYLSAYCVGCLSTLSPEYARLTSWNLGFATIEISKKGDFKVNNYKIFKGKIY